MFIHESFISIEKGLIFTNADIPNPCNEVDQENYTSNTILSNINQDIHAKAVDDFAGIFDLLLIKGIDLSIRIFNLEHCYKQFILSWYITSSKFLYSQILFYNSNFIFLNSNSILRIYFFIFGRYFTFLYK